MGSDLAAIGAERFAQAETILGWSVREKCEADSAELAKTEYTQPCLYVISAILADVLRDRGHRPDLVAGHSLGEYGALYCAGVLDFETGLELVKQRSRLMAAASGGAMTALIGFDRAALEEAVDATEGVIIANDNSPLQVVLSGTPEAIARVCDRVKTKRALPLPVSGAFHSPMMAEAAAAFGTLLDGITFRDAAVPVLSNVVPDNPTQSGMVLRDRLRQQMTAPVRWREICLQLPGLGIERAIEVGPGKVLTGLIDRTVPGLTLHNIGTLAAAESLEV